MGECFIEGKRKIAMRGLNKKGKSYVESIIKGTLALWDYNDKVEIIYERIGEGTFTNDKIGAVNREPATIVVNINWYETAEERDIKGILRHEARHLYQRSQVRKYLEGLPISEDPKKIEEWAKNFQFYIPNTPMTEVQHFKQACEYDAYVYSTFLDSVEHYKNGTFNMQIIQYPGIADALEREVGAKLNKMSEREIKMLKERLRI